MRAWTLHILILAWLTACSPYTPCIQTESDPVIDLDGLNGLDPAYGVEGRTYVNINDLVAIPQVSIDDEGALRLSASDRRGVKLARLTSSGKLDETFGTLGIKEIPLPFRADHVLRLVDGKTIAIGLAKREGKDFIEIVRIDAEGNFDLAYAKNGIAQIPISLAPAYRLRAAGVNAAGELAVVSQITDVAEVKLPGVTRLLPILYTTDLYIYRVSADGSLSAGFGNNGIVHKVGAEAGIYLDSITTVFVSDDNSVLIGGDAYDSAPVGEHMAMLKLRADGTVDYSFGLLGRATAPIVGKSGQIAQIQKTGEGKWLVLGRVGIVPNTSIALARFLENGQRDHSFADAGVREFRLEGRDIFGDSLLQLSDGRLLVGGNVRSYRQATELNGNACTWVGQALPQRQWAFFLFDANGAAHSPFAGERGYYGPGIGGYIWAGVRAMFEMGDGRLQAVGNTDQTFVGARLLPFP